MHHFRGRHLLRRDRSRFQRRLRRVGDITQDQPSLKRLHWQVHWYDAQGVEGFFERSFWLHEDSLYWEEYGWKEKFLDYVSDLRLPN
ncbi:MAG: hypothetical protein R2856_09435 [Caldilineaceae bacterium]